MASVVDLFAGCGGLGLGLEQAGFEPVFVSELNADAMQTYLQNRPGSGLDDPRRHAYDIHDITSPDVLDGWASSMRREHGEISLVAGGPPCQGYSGIGHRRTFKLEKHEIPSNHLYGQMALVIQALAPRAFLFENVRGLLNARWTSDGQKGEIWEDVQRTFRAIEVKHGGRTLHYEIHPALVFAKDYGIAQNRPRVLLVGVRSDVGTNTDPGGVAGGFLPPPTRPGPDLGELLGDLVDPNWAPGGATNVYPSAPQNDLQRRLRTRLDGTIAGKGAPVTEHEYSNHSPVMIEKFAYMLANNGEIPEALRTKKFAQRVWPRAWGENGPSVTATSLADDYVHFSQPRTPTVREWARLQDFPDHYRFAGKRTTGGRRRAGDPSKGEWARDVPKFTQIGNAVPVGLGREVGAHLRSILDI